MFLQGFIEYQSNLLPFLKTLHPDLLRAALGEDIQSQEEKPSGVLPGVREFSSIDSSKNIDHIDTKKDAPSTVSAKHKKRIPKENKRTLRKRIVAYFMDNPNISITYAQVVEAVIPVNQKQFGGMIRYIIGSEDLPGLEKLSNGDFINRVEIS